MPNSNSTAEWDDEDAQELIEDEAARRAAERLQAQLELFPELKSSTPDEGRKTSFAIRPTDLKNLAQVTKLNPKLDEENDIAVEVAGNRLRVAAQRGSVTCRATAPLEPSYTGGPYCFGFPHWQLQALGSRFSDALNCKLDLDQAEFAIRYGKTKLRLNTYETPNCPSASLEPQQQAASKRFDPDMLKQCLFYTGLVARKNKYTPMLGVVEIENGQGRGGDTEHVAVFEDAALKGLPLRIVAEDVKTVRSILGRMNRAKTKFYETATHQVMFDDVTECSIEKPKFSFPPIGKLLAEIPTDRFRVSMYDLASKAALLSAAGVHSRDVVVKLERAAAYGHKLILSVQGSCVSCRTVIESIPVSADITAIRDRKLTISLRSLARLARISDAINTDWVEFALSDRKVMIAHLYADCDGRHARTFIAARHEGTR